MKKSIFLFFAAILCSMTANAYTVYFNTGNINWADSDAKFQVWTGSKNVDATKIGGNWYSFEVGDATGTMYFKRYSPTGDQWNEFNVSISSTNNCVRLTDWNKGEISSLHVTGDSWNGIGNWSNSNTAGKMIIDGTTFTKTFENVSSEAHKFKLTFKGTWDNAIGYSSNVSCVNGEVADDEGNIKFTPKIAGDVTITYNMADGKIVIECATPKYSVTTSASPAEGGVVSGGGIYAGGSSVTLTATPAEGYEFVNWTKGETVVSISKEYTFTVQEDVSLVANFKVPVPDVAKYQVTVSANDNAMGSVTGGGEYEEGATALLTATPNAGYQFVNWTVDETEKSTETTYSFTVTEAVEVVANFEVIPTTTVYFVNAEDWTGTINAYAWTDGSPKVENAGWPGVAAHKEDYQIEGHDVYSYTAEEGKYANIIFNGTGGQTADLVWTAGQYACKNEWCADEAAVLAKLNGPVEYESVYFVNVNGWAAVNIYTWSPGVGTWPGVAMTKEAEQLGGYDVYSYTVEKGTTFGGFNFNEGDQKRKTDDLTWTAGKYYVIDNWYTKAEAEAKLATLVEYDYYIAGTKAMTGHEWNAAGLGMEGDAEKGMYSHDFTLAAGSHEFKVTNGTWESSWGFSNVARKYKEVSEGKNGEGEPNGNVKITLDKETAVTVVFYSKDKTIEFNGLTLIHTVTVTAENGTVTGAGDYADGETVTLTAIPDEGYEFVNWTANEKELSTETTYSFTAGTYDNIVANFAKKEYTVTVAAENGTIEGLAADGKYKHGEQATLTAIPASGYKFLNWTVGEDVVAETAEYTFTVTENCDLVANFVKDQGTALDNIVTSKAPIKVIENGQLFVIKNGVKYNVLGAIVK